MATSLRSHPLIVACLAALATGAVPCSGQSGTSPVVELPLQTENDWFIVPVVVNGEDSLRFILDTGASVSAVTTGTASRLRLPEGQPTVATGASGSQRMRTTAVESLTLGGLISSRVQMLVVDDATLTPNGGREGGLEPYDGVLGLDLLRLFDVLIDPVAGVLRLYEPGEDPATEVLAGLADPVTLHQVVGPIGGHYVEVEGVRLPAVLDTGSRRVVLNRAAALAAGVEPEFDAATARESPGVGTRTIEIRASRITALEAGDTGLGAMHIGVAELPVFRVGSFGNGPAVLLGNPALQRCAIFLAYSANQVRYCRSPAG